MAKILLTEEAAPPASPAADTIALYTLDTDADARKVLYSKNPGGGIRVMGNIPAVDATWDLGDNATPLKWRDLFLSRNLAAGGTIAATQALAGQQYISVRNTDAGTVAQASLLVGNDSSLLQGSLDVFGSGFTTAGGDAVAGGVRLLANGAGGLAYRTSHASGTHRWYSGTTLVLSIAAAGGVVVPAGSVAISNGILSFGAANASIIAGPTSFSIRDSTNAFNNVVITDAGAVTARGGLTVNGPIAGTSKLLDLNATNGAIVLPRLTKAQRNALTPVDGMLIWQTDSIVGLHVYGSTGWSSFVTAGTDP